MQVELEVDTKEGKDIILTDVPAEVIFTRWGLQIKLVNDTLKIHLQQVVHEQNRTVAQGSDSPSEQFRQP